MTSYRLTYLSAGRVRSVCLLAGSPAAAQTIADWLADRIGAVLLTLNFDRG